MAYSTTEKIFVFLAVAEIFLHNRNISFMANSIMTQIAVFQLWPKKFFQWRNIFHKRFYYRRNSFFYLIMAKIILLWIICYDQLYYNGNSCFSIIAKIFLSWPILLRWNLLCFNYGKNNSFTVKIFLSRKILLWWK